MLMLYNVRKGQIINQSREKKEAKKKEDDAQEIKKFVSYLCMTCVWKKMYALGIEPSADNSLFYFGMKEVWDQDQLLKGI